MNNYPLGPINKLQQEERQQDRAAELKQAELHERPYLDGAQPLQTRRWWQFWRRAER